ncbi:hypothetical protein LINGRAHAP2_LOCUS557 [Linum grandiflorum]
MTKGCWSLANFCSYKFPTLNHGLLFFSLKQGRGVTKRKMDVLMNLTSSSKWMLSTPPDCITISSDSDSSDYEDEFRKDRYWFDWSKKKDNLARYIFERRRDMKEVLVQQDDIECDRVVIRSLIPGTKMDVKDAAMKGLKPEKAFSDYQFSYLEAAGNCQEMTFTTELFKVVYANCGKPDTSPPIRDFPLKLTKPYRLMNRKELAVYLATGYANMKRNEVLMRAERLGKKKVVCHLEFNG